MDRDVAGAQQGAAVTLLDEAAPLNEKRDRDVVAPVLAHMVRRALDPDRTAEGVQDHAVRGDREPAARRERQIGREHRRVHPGQSCAAPVIEGALLLDRVGRLDDDGNRLADTQSGSAPGANNSLRAFARWNLNEANCRSEVAAQP